MDLNKLNSVARSFINNSMRYFLFRQKKLFTSVAHTVKQPIKKKKTDSFYISNENSAKIIAKYILEDFRNDQIFIEANPGYGFLTKHILNSNIHKIVLFEEDEQYTQQLQNMCSSDMERVKIRNINFSSLWKLSFRDSLDGGNRFKEALKDIPSSNYSDDTKVRIFLGTSSLIFFKFLISSLTFQDGFLSHTRSEMFLIMPPPLYIHLTCNNEAGYLIYRSMTILFQIMFEHKFLSKISRNNFLPKQRDKKLKNTGKLVKINSIDSDYLYLVKITPRRNLYKLCPPEHIQALWFFIKQNYYSRKNRVIPNLEKWIPRCGPRLIMNQNDHILSEPIDPNENINDCPKYTTLCHTLSDKDYYPFINIHTEFGDLSPIQVFTLFSMFRKWPEYKDSLFMASLENNLLKMQSSYDDNIAQNDLTEKKEEDVLKNLTELENIK